MKYILTILLISLSFLFPSWIFSQTETGVGQLVELRTDDGNTYVGEIKRMTESEIVLMTQSLGEITLERSSITKVIYKNGDQELDKNAYPVDYHNSTHYLVNPSAFSLKKGQSYYENIGVFFNSYSVGITDNFSISGGLELISPLFDKRAPSLYFSPKFSLPFGEKAGGVSVGSTLLVAFDGGDPITIGVVQASLTLGSRNNNFTVGSGIGYSFDNGITDEVLPFYLSGMWRLSKKISLITDNFIIVYDGFNDAFGLLSAAVRIHFSNGAAFNAGLWRPTEDAGDLLALPFISATIPLK